MRVLTGWLMGLGIGASLGLVVLWVNTAPDVVDDRGGRSAVASVGPAVPRRSDGRVDRLMRDGERQARQPRRETPLSARTAERPRPDRPRQDEDSVAATDRAITPQPNRGLTAPIDRTVYTDVGVGAVLSTPATAVVQATAIVQEGRARIAVTAANPTGLRQWNARVDRMIDDDDLRARQIRDDTSIRGRTHERLSQYHEDLPVFGADITRQAVGGLTLSIFGTAYTDIDLDPTPGLSADEAKVIIETLAGAELGPTRIPELVVLPRDETGDYVLTYHERVMSTTGLTAYFIDAYTGDLVLQRSDLKTQQATLPCTQCDVGEGDGVLGDRKKISVRSAAGVYVAHDKLRPPDLFTFDMQGDLDKTIDFLNGVTALFDSDLATDTDNVWTDGANVDAHVYAGWTYDYLFKRFGRRGLDDSDLRILSLVHPVRRQDWLTAPPGVFGLFYLNAFYAGNGVMVYGEGLPPEVIFLGLSWNFFSAALDVVAHELAHGVTEFSSQLIYQDESGALDEAFSDIIATGVEFFFQASGSGLLEADYLIGEDIATPGGIRSMENPGLFGDPDHFSNLFTGPEDNGGVHTNALIATHAFYLAIEGGTNSTSGLGVAGVGAANREQIENIFYRAFVLLLPSNATFSVARAATIQAAQDLYGAGSAAEQAVIDAWTAVGVT